MVVDTPICLPQVYSFVCPHWSPRCQCAQLKKKKKKLTFYFLNFLPPRSDPMTWFWPARCKQQFPGRNSVFLIKSQSVLFTLPLSPSCLENIHGVWMFSSSLVSEDKSNFEDCKDWLPRAAALALNSLLNHVLLCEKHKPHTFKAALGWVSTTGYET